MNRAELINYLVQSRGYRSYLEIGCAGNWTFDQVTAPEKVGVDPVAGGTERCTSDEYFARTDRRFDLIFIDGDHHSAQVTMDIANALAHLAPGGAIVVHDCLPEKEADQEIGPGDFWIGDGWRSVAALLALPGIDVATGAFDCGVAVILDRPSTRRRIRVAYHTGASWRDYAANRLHWLRVMEWPELREWIARDA